MAKNKVKFDLAEVNKEVAALFIEFDAAKTAQYTARSAAAKAERYISSFDKETATEDELRKFAEVVEQQPALKEAVKAANTRLKEAASEIVSPEVYAAYVAGMSAGDYNTRPDKNTRSFAELMRGVLDRLGGHGLTDSALQKFSRDISAKVGGRATSGKEYASGLFFKAATPAAFRIACIQAMLQVLTTSYPVFKKVDAVLSVLTLEDIKAAKGGELE